jgi:hypothetical protein
MTTKARAANSKIRRRSPSATGVDTADHSKSIDKINIEMTAWGAPRYWVLGGGKRVPVMPAEIPVRLRSRSPVRAWGHSTILKPKWVRIPMKDASAPYDPREARTKYRQSIPIDQAEDFATVVEGETQEVATVVKSGYWSDRAFRSALGWASRGIAEQPSNAVNDSGDERLESIAALRLLQAGGVEVLEVEAMVKVKKDPKKGVAKRLIRSPADVFYYSGDTNDDGCRAIGKDCWAVPKDLKGYWQWPFDLEVLILAGCSALNITFPYDIANGPGDAAPLEADRHCNRGLRLRRAAPSRGSCSVAAAHAFGNSYTAAYYIPSTLSIVDSGAVRQSFPEPEDAYPDAQDYADLLPRGVFLFLTLLAGLDSRRRQGQRGISFVSREGRPSFRPTN